MSMTKVSENRVEKGENAGKPAFCPFPTMFFFFLFLFKLLNKDEFKTDEYFMLSYVKELNYLIVC